MASPKTSKAYLFGEIHTGVYLHVASKKGPSLTPVVMAKAHGIPSLQCEAYSVELLWPTKNEAKEAQNDVSFFFARQADRKHRDGGSLAITSDRPSRVHGYCSQISSATAR